MSDQDLGGDTSTMLAKVGDSSIHAWSEDKKKDFVKTFKDRARVAQYILAATAEELCRSALTRHFISNRHARSIDDAPFRVPTDYEVSAGQGSHHGYDKIGGRSIRELDQIANQRAKAILNELPAVRKAVEVIRPDVAKMMDRRDKLQEKGQALCDELDTLREEVKLADLDQNLTVGALRQMVKDREKRKKTIIDQLDEIGEEGTELEVRIAKELYAGLPGLSDAVVKVALQHKERATALDQVQRRVEEKVMFGDSREAMAILEKFEKDEVEVSAQVKAEFGVALQKLQLAGKKSRKGKN